MGKQHNQSLTLRITRLLGVPQEPRTVVHWEVMRPELGVCSLLKGKM
uniref:Uncharacterized protein n=1 Tax=Populus trichocarpa TaxID=3694 RepID=A9PAX3_POPTR|nr:unknown [Populus trichocarpa]